MVSAFRDKTRRLFKILRFCKHYSFRSEDGTVVFDETLEDLQQLTSLVLKIQSYNWSFILISVLDS
jgi:hypothetical protein